MTNRNRTWWRNVRNGGDVSLLLKGKSIKAFAKVELDEKAVEGRLIEYIQHVPMAARSLGIQVKDKTPQVEDIVRVAKARLFVKITLS